MRPWQRKLVHVNELVYWPWLNANNQATPGDFSLSILYIDLLTVKAIQHINPIIFTVQAACAI